MDAEYQIIGERGGTGETKISQRRYVNMYAHIYPGLRWYDEQ
jgi:hypothetical protein